MNPYDTGVEIDPEFPVRECGSIREKLKPGPKSCQPRADHLAKQRMCAARLKAERRGKDTSKFPERIRRVNKRVAYVKI